MADSKLSALTEMTELTQADELYVNDGGTSKRITHANLARLYMLAKTGAYTLTAAENGKVVHCDGTFTVTLPQDTTEDLIDGFWAIVWNIGTGIITLAIEGSDVLTASAATIPAKKSAAVWKKTGTAWYASGGLG